MKRVLVIDDVEDNRELLVQLLEDEYEVIAASDGREALRAALRDLPDLIITDVSLPGLDGYELIRTLRRTPQFAERPILVVTARAMPGEREKAVRAGCDEYLTKPLDAALLLETVAKYA